MRDNWGLHYRRESYEYIQPINLQSMILEDVLKIDEISGGKIKSRHSNYFIKPPKKGVILMKMNEKKDFQYDIWATMKPQVREYWLIYNSANYFDTYLGMYTYLNDVASYLSLFREKTKDLGMCFASEKDKPKKVKFDGPTVGNFHFYNQKGYIACRQKALLIQKDEEFIKATKEMVNIFVEDAESARARILNQIFSIVESESTTQSVKLDGLYKAAKMLGVDVKETTNKLDITLRGLESAKGLEDLDFTNCVEEDEEEEKDKEDN